ncbi:hypothetical protein D3C86_1304030 [compost metagenome]
MQIGDVAHRPSQAKAGIRDSLDREQVGDPAAQEASQTATEQTEEEALGQEKADHLVDVHPHGPQGADLAEALRHAHDQSVHDGGDEAQEGEDGHGLGKVLHPAQRREQIFVELLPGEHLKGTLGCKLCLQGLGEGRDLLLVVQQDADLADAPRQPEQGLRVGKLEARDVPVQAPDPAAEGPHHLVVLDPQTPLGVVDHHRDGATHPCLEVLGELLAEQDLGGGGG